MSCTHEAVSILLSHGYDVHRDRWLQNARLPQTVSSNTRTLIHARLSCVVTLSQLCRTALRRRLREVNGGKDLARRTSRLPLPQLLQEFLLYAHQPNNWCTVDTWCACARASLRACLCACLRYVGFHFNKSSTWMQSLILIMLFMSTLTVILYIYIIFVDIRVCYRYMARSDLLQNGINSMYLLLFIL